MSLDAFVLLCKAHGLPEPETEVVFAPPRKWRADYLFREARIIVEREGGIWSKNPRAQAAHARPLKIVRDMEKANAAQLLGFRYFRYQPKDLDSGVAVEQLKQVLGKVA